MRTAASATRVCSAPASASEYTAMTRMPRRCAVRVMRQAISPRLAISRLLNIYASARVLKELAPDQHAADFARPRTDLVKFGIAQQTAGGVIIDIAIAAQGLDGIERAASGALAGKKNAPGRIKARGAPPVAGPRDAVHVGTRGVQRRIQIRKLCLDQLEAADRRAKLLALAHVGQHHVKTALHDAERSPGEHYALVVKSAHHPLPPPPRLVQDILERHATVLEHELTGIRAAHAELVELLRGAEAGEILLHDEGRNAWRARLRVRLRVHHQHIRRRPIGNPHLAAVEEIVVAGQGRA